MAHILLDQGHTVSGSDQNTNRLTATLAQRGATIYAGHNATYVHGADALLASAAIPAEHIELAAARQANLPLLRRDNLWYEWSQQRTIIAVAGTHGKTTTTAMIAWVLQQAGRDPGFLVGSESPDLGTNARWGSPAAPLVIEADEYGRAFLALVPHVVVVTNVEWDHPDIYPTASDYIDTFAQFIDNSEGPIITCGDGGIGSWSRITRENSLPLLSYGLEEHNSYRAILSDAQKPTNFQVWRSKDAPTTVYNTGDTQLSPISYKLLIPGQHNIKNALAAIVVADMFGLEAEPVARALRTFRGTARRFEIKGEASGVTVVDDYAHHPTEVRATLAAARAHYGQRRIVAYVQPHTYSRTLALIDEWPAAFADADVVLVGAVYASRERDVDGTHARIGHRLTERIAAAHPNVSYVGGLDEASGHVQHVLQSGDVLLTLGAGDGDAVGAAVLAAGGGLLR